jgi:hypothetical protein
MAAKNVENTRPPIIFENEQEMGLPPIFGDDADTENAWSQWREDLKTSDAKGKIRVAKVPMEDGAPNMNKRGQVQLFAVPHDQYNYDELLDIIRARFMKAGETICVRLTGMRVSGSSSGVVPFNRLLMLSKGSEPVAPEGGTQLGEILQAMQNQQAAQATMLREILTPKTVESNPNKRDTVDTMIAIAGALTPLLTPIIAGIMTRPKPQNELGSLIDAMVKMQSLRDGTATSNNEDDNSTMSIIKAVAPAGMQLLTALAQRPAAQSQPVQRAAPDPRRIPLAAPVQNTAEKQDPVKVVENVTPKPAVSAGPMPSAGQENADMFAALKPVLSNLVDMAKDNTPIPDTAKLLLGMLPEEYDEQLYNAVETPVAFARLALLEPRIKEHAEWFENLRVELLKEYQDNPAEDVPPAAGSKLVS